MSCNKEPEIIVPEGCVSILEFVELLGGEELVFRNLKTDETKVLKYNPDLSIQRDFVCQTSRGFPHSNLFYTSDVGDTIVYSIDVMSYQLDFEKYNFNGIPSIYGGFSYDLFRRFQLISLNEADDYVVAYLLKNILEGRIAKLFVGMEDSNGNKWILDGYDVDDIFFCEIIDNLETVTLDNLKQKNLIENHLEELKFRHNDSLEIWKLNKAIVGQYLVQKIDSFCANNRLFITPILRTEIELFRKNRSTISFSNLIQFDFPNREELYSETNVLYETLKNEFEPNTSIYYGYKYCYSEDPFQVVPNDSFYLDPYILHPSFKLDETTYHDVYEIGVDKRKLFFNYEFGFLAYHNIDSLLFTRITE